jgi:hypothetical protein
VLISAGAGIEIPAQELCEHLPRSWERNAHPLALIDHAAHFDSLTITILQQTKELRQELRDAMYMKSEE